MTVRARRNEEANSCRRVCAEPSLRWVGRGWMATRTKYVHPGKVMSRVFCNFDLALRLVSGACPLRLWETAKTPPASFVNPERSTTVLIKIALPRITRV